MNNRILFALVPGSSGQDDQLLLSLINTNLRDRFLLVAEEKIAARLMADVERKSSVVIVDELSPDLYDSCFGAFLGGGYDPELLYEPVLRGIPVAFGQEYADSVQARELIDAEAGFAFDGFEPFNRWYLRLRMDLAFSSACAKNCLTLQSRKK